MKKKKGMVEESLVSELETRPGGTVRDIIPPGMVTETHNPPSSLRNDGTHVRVGTGNLINCHSEMIMPGLSTLQDLGGQIESSDLHSRKAKE